MKVVKPVPRKLPRYEVSVVVVPRPADPGKFKNDGRYPDEFGGLRWWGECGSKVAFQLKMDADRVCYENRHRYYKKGKTLHVYTCPWRDWFHIGHIPSVSPKPESGDK